MFPNIKDGALFADTNPSGETGRSGGESEGLLFDAWWEISQTEIGKFNYFSPGICMRQKAKFDRDALHFAPFVLLPSPFPKDEYYKAVKLQTVLNELMHKARMR